MWSWRPQVATASAVAGSVGDGDARLVAKVLEAGAHPFEDPALPVRGEHYRPRGLPSDVRGLHRRGRDPAGEPWSTRALHHDLAGSLDAWAREELTFDGPALPELRDVGPDGAAQRISRGRWGT